MSEEQSGIVEEVGPDGVLRIVVDRPEVGNSLSPLSRDALSEAFERAHCDREVLARSEGDGLRSAGLDGGLRRARHRDGEGLPRAHQHLAAPFVTR